jgi:hypothetical protein
MKCGVRNSECGMVILNIIAGPLRFRASELAYSFVIRRFVIRHSPTRPHD